MVTSLTSEQWSEILAWATVVIAILIVAADIQALLYFRRERDRLAKAAGRSNWVMTAIVRTVLTITAVAGWLTLARGFVLWQDDVPGWLPVINGLFLIWLLLLPRILMHYFRRREGGP